MIEIKDLHKSFGSLNVLNGINEHISRGEKVVVIGPSGSGKSTFLRCLNMLETPTSGEILFDGVSMTDPKTNINEMRRKMGMVFQHFNLFNNLTILDNMTLAPVRLKLKSKAEAKEDAMALLKRVGLEDKAMSFPSQLSGGQKQRCALARMLIGRPGILMLDEPFSALDSYLRWELERELLSTLREYDGTVLFVSHDRDEVYRISDRIAVYQNGTIDVIGDKWELFRQPITCTAAILTGCKNVAEASYSEKTVTVPQWGLTLPLPADGLPDGVTHLGIRARKMLPATAPGPRCFRYAVAEEIDGAFSDILMIRLEGGTDLMRWEITKDVHAAMKDGPNLIEIPEDAVLYLRP